MARQTDRQAGRQAETDRLETERKTETVREGETQRQTDKDTEHFCP